MVSSPRGAPADLQRRRRRTAAQTTCIYQYDSHRIPWRIGLDYCWNGTAAAKTYLDKTSGFFSGKASNGVGRVFDIYNLNGMETSNAAVNSGSAIGTAAAGAMSNTSYSTFMNDGYQLVLDLLNRGTIGDRLPRTAMSVKSGYSYFNATVGLLMLLTMSGNFQLVAEGDPDAIGASSLCLVAGPGGSLVASRAAGRPRRRR